jgi:hypothetical protein
VDGYERSVVRIASRLVSLKLASKSSRADVRREMRSVEDRELVSEMMGAVDLTIGTGLMEKLLVLLEVVGGSGGKPMEMMVSVPASTGAGGVGTWCLWLDRVVRDDLPIGLECVSSLGRGLEIGNGKDAGLLREDGVVREVFEALDLPREDLVTVWVEKGDFEDLYGEDLEPD